MKDRSSLALAGKSSPAPPTLVIVEGYASGAGWTTDTVDGIMCHVPIEAMQSTRRGVAIVAHDRSFKELRQGAFYDSWQSWVGQYNGDQAKLRIVVQDANNEDFLCVIGPPGADVIIEIIVFDRYFFGLNDGPFQQEVCGQQLLRWDAFFTTIFPGCETTLTTGYGLKDWLMYGVSLTEQGPHHQEVVLLSGPNEVTHHRLNGPLSQAC